MRISIVFTGEEEQEIGMEVINQGLFLIKKESEKAEEEADVLGNDTSLFEALNFIFCNSANMKEAPFCLCDLKIRVEKKNGKALGSLEVGSFPVEKS